MTNDISNWTLAWGKLQNDLHITHFGTIESTNTFAKTMDATPKKNQLVFAADQTKGRGRGTNTWLAPRVGSALLSSWVFDLEFTPQPILPALVGVGVSESLNVLGGFENIALKAPNDIYMQDKKVCGILIENLSQGASNRLIIGIGMNVFDEPEVPNASCVQKFRNKKIDDASWVLFLDTLYKNLKSAVFQSKNETLSMDARQKILWSLNQNIILKEKYLDVLPSGEIKTPKGLIHWSQI